MLLLTPCTLPIKQKQIADYAQIMVVVQVLPKLVPAHGAAPPHILSLCHPQSLSLRMVPPPHTYSLSLRDKEVVFNLNWL